MKGTVQMAVTQQNQFPQQKSTKKVLLQLIWHLATPTEPPMGFSGFQSEGRQEGSEHGREG